MASSKPKVLHEVGNYPMLFHILDTVSSFKNSFVNIVISHSLLDYKDLIISKYNKVTFSIQSQQKGTADAVKSSLTNIKKNPTDYTIVLCGDTPLISKKTIEKSLNKLVKNNLDLCVISMKPENKKNSYGKLKFKENKLIGIIEQSEIKKQDHKDICNSGIMIFKTKRLIENLKLVNNNNRKKEYFLTDLVDIFYKQNFSIDHYVCNFNETLGVNNLIDLSRVNNEFQKIKRRSFLSRELSWKLLILLL